MSIPVYSIAVPVHNEQEVLPELCQRLAALMDQLDGEAEVILVDDGSTDGSYKFLTELHQKDARFKAVQLSRNFGQQSAMTIGIALAQGQAVVIMDADLQDPPEVVLEMAAKWREGYDIVYGLREDRLGEPWWKRTASKMFHRLLCRLTDIEFPSGVGEFRLIDAKAADAFLSMREHNRYVRGMLHWIGFKQTGVKFQRTERYAGQTNYGLRGMLRVAVDAVFSFSLVPLRLVLQLGLAIAGISAMIGMTALLLKIFDTSIVVPGWASLLVAVSFMGGVQLVVLGVLGEYVGRIYEEVRNRPIYLIRDLLGFADGALITSDDLYKRRTASRQAATKHPEGL
jgi:glycosyltransferase involved in cell wall biosynthesis